MIGPTLARRPGAAVLAAAIAGALSVAGFAPFGWAVLAPASLAFLCWLWLSTDSPRRAALIGHAWGLGHFGVGASWVYVSLHEYGAMPAPLAALATLLFCAYLALFPALVGSLQARCVTGPAARAVLLIPALWTLAEWLRGWLLTGFPWLATGYSQIDTPLAGFAPLGGVLAVSFCTLVSAGMAVSMLGAGRRSRYAWAAGIVALLLAGQTLRSIGWTAAAGKPLEVALVQGNIAQSLKFEPGRYGDTLATYLRLVERSHARLIVLPETAMPRFFDTIDAAYLERLARHARLRDGDLLLGVPLADRGGRYYNSVVTLGSSPLQTYAKRHLVPLGEFVPPEFGWILRTLRIPLSDFTPGTERPEPLAVAGERVAVNICYEDAFGEEIIRQLPLATLLVNVSNVAWFGDSLAPEQHLQISRMRALETGRYMLRATNTGVTAIVDPAGHVALRLPQFAEGLLEAEVQGYAGATPYTRMGNYAALALAIAALLLAMAVQRARSP